MLQHGEGEFPPDVEVQVKDPDFSEKQIEHQQSNSTIGQYEEGTGEVGPKINESLLMSLVAMSFLWTGSQIPLYLFGSICPVIYGDIGGADRYVWFSGGMVIAGVGAGINELTALAATSELAPTSKRGTYNSLLLLTILPFMPAGLYAQLIAAYGTWRYNATIPAAWNAFGFILVACFYFPPPRPNTQGRTKKEILKSVDYGGGFLFISGIIVFLSGIQWGGYQ
ncbi:hypothetical protein KEM56_004350, partial [Ascosphaera pollenicola]